MAGQAASDAEYICTFCDRGQCARCRDERCECCGGVDAA